MSSSFTLLWLILFLSQKKPFRHVETVDQGVVSCRFDFIELRVNVLCEILFQNRLKNQVGLLVEGRHPD
jgi:hypothetical protein